MCLWLVCMVTAALTPCTVLLYEQQPPNSTAPLHIALTQCLLTRSQHLKVVINSSTMDRIFKCLSLKRGYKQTSLPRAQVVDASSFIKLMVNALFVLVWRPAPTNQFDRGPITKYHTVKIFPYPPHCVREWECLTGDGCSRLPNGWKGEGRAAGEGGDADGRPNSTCSPCGAPVPLPGGPQVGSSESKGPPRMCSWKKQEPGRQWSSLQDGGLPHVHWVLKAEGWDWSWTAAEGQQRSEPGSRKWSMGGREKGQPNSCWEHPSPHSSDRPITSSPSECTWKHSQCG